MHRLILEAKRQAEKLERSYRIRPHGRAFRIWKMFDEWKPIQERASREDCEDYLFNKLPPIESEL